MTFQWKSIYIYVILIKNISKWWITINKIITLLNDNNNIIIIYILILAKMNKKIRLNSVW